jgi:Holliday junction resolvase RusA-like endonuclease
VIRLVVPGPPVGKGRPKFARAGKFVHVYTPKETAAAENKIALIFATAYPGHKPFTGPVHLFLRAYMPIPTSTPKKRAGSLSNEKTPHTKKTDLDNIIKLYLDALSNVYVDDAQVFDISACKYYSGNPRVEVDIYEEGE